ncbi:chromatin remodelling complex Rsc7/Swp82 subunit-domain-containing protein, partial [Halteromyces radiatus]|uniref:chromatin remodelling complex Rsc7/Swp82 subunit-domain-containing protein n=1 Tax=Halteromyces radiatus TaxID=101107 RepID=UPI00221FBD59
MKNTSTSSNLGKRKGRPPKSKNHNSGTVDDINFLDDESDLSFDEYMDTSDGEASNKKRGRNTNKPKQNEQPYTFKEEESDIDETGETKVDADGHLLDGRQYRVPTFELPERGRTLFMFAKDPAALLGFRDSFVFMKKNPKLVKVYLRDSEKSHLVDTNRLRSTFRTREVSVVEARSVYKVFGHRVVKKGRRGRDDYYYTGEYDENEEVDSEEDNKAQHHMTDDKLLSGTNTSLNSAWAHPIQQHQQSGYNSNMLPSHFIGTAGSSPMTGGNMMGSVVLGNSITGHPIPSPFGSLSATALAQQQMVATASSSGGIIDPLTNTPINIKQMNVPVSLKSTLQPLNANNWLHHAAVSVRDFSAQLHSYRQNNTTFYDIHTNVYQIPHAKQAIPSPKPYKRPSSL